MKFFPLVWRNLLRRKVRTTFTLLSIFVAFVLFGFLMAIRTAFGVGVDIAGRRSADDDRQDLAHQAAPAVATAAHRSRPRASIDVTHANWFGGIYQDPKNSSPNMAVEPESWLRIYPEFAVPEDQKKAWLADRTGAIVGADTREAVRLEGRRPRAAAGRRSTGRRTAAPWEFTIDGIYDSPEKGVDKTQFFFHYDYMNETIREPELRPRSGRLVRDQAEGPVAGGGDRAEARRDVRQLAERDQDRHREGVRRRLRQADRRHRQHHDRRSPARCCSRSCWCRPTPWRRRSASGPTSWRS